MRNILLLITILLFMPGLASAICVSENKLRYCEGDAIWLAGDLDISVRGKEGEIKKISTVDGKRVFQIRDAFGAIEYYSPSRVGVTTGCALGKDYCVGDRVSFLYFSFIGHGIAETSARDGFVSAIFQDGTIGIGEEQGYSNRQWQVNLDKVAIASGCLKPGVCVGSTAKRSVERTGFDQYGQGVVVGFYPNSTKKRRNILIRPNEWGRNDRYNARPFEEHVSDFLYETKP